MYDDRFLKHRCSYDHPERAARLEAMWSGLSRRGAVAASALIPARRATVKELSAVHDRQYVDDTLAEISGRWGFLDGDTFFSPDSEEAALRAAGGAIDLARAVYKGDVAWGFALPRPPGHHATRTRAMGFCIFNNLAVAARALLSEGVRRILIFDWDVHHGNGTQDAFEDSPDVLFISVHQWPHFPGTGLNREIGVDAGKGYTVNIPFPAGASDGDYIAALKEVVEPLASAFNPEMILVSAGFDAHEKDFLAGMRVTTEGFAYMAGRIQALAQKTGRGPCLVLEGGYHLEALRQSAEAVVEVLEGAPPPKILQSPSHGCLESIAATLANIKPFWPNL
jgi:acetoin utilization deacetylase AcuC-like enzyme